ncbi:MAG: oxidoreductase [Candidatus Rokuibacteriota bacterium]|nr:MAG: oxidoreductase [Candidatus Rokubacteria bacterium]
MIRMGVIGYGYWGPNIVRNLRGVDGCEVATVCDRSPGALTRVAQAYPEVATTRDASELMTSPKIDAVAIVTPVHTHFPLAKSALQHGKHVFIEKPFTATTAQAEELIELAARRNLTIMVDHTFLFTGAVRKIRQLMDEGVLGDIYYYDSTRVNLGLFQHDVSVVWDLAPHDLSIMDFLIHGKPEAVIATGETHLNGLVDVAYITVYFPGNTIAHINVNWLSPVKIRTTLIGGEKRMLVWNDLEADEKLKIYDKGVAMNGNGHGNGKQGLYELLVSYRSGDMWAPRVEQTEALKVELSYFIDCVRTTQTPINDGVAGLRVVQLLEAADRSLKERGRTVTL